MAVGNARCRVELLAPAGELLFSTNLRSFRVDAAALAGLNVTDISAQTVPPDFRNRKIHKCWRITPQAQIAVAER